MGSIQCSVEQSIIYASVHFVTLFVQRFKHKLGFRPLPTLTVSGNKAGVDP